MSRTAILEPAQVFSARVKFEMTRRFLSGRGQEKARKWLQTMLLFLDIDGVLHPHINYQQELLFSRLPLLENVLRACPGVDVVVSSTWRLTRTLPELREIFSADIRQRIVGTTPRWQDIQDDAAYGTYVRQSEIEAWLNGAGRAWEPWVALDDQPALFRPFCKQLVLTNSLTAFTAENCATLVKRLSI